MKKLIALLPLIIACNDKKVDAPKTESRKTTETVKTTTSVKPVVPATPLFGDAEVEALPLADSTNFDNFEQKAHPISEAKIKAMNLSEIAPKGAKFYYRYRVESPAGYDLALITAETEMELFTELVSFDKNHKMIDEAPVAYDEIAESFTQKTGKIEKDKVTVTTINYSNTEDGEKHVQIFKITPQGKFINTNKVKK